MDEIFRKQEEIISNSYPLHVNEKTFIEIIGGERVEYTIKYGEYNNVAYKINGKYSRLYGPAVIHFNIFGIKISETWYLNDYIHRYNLPAIYEYCDDGELLISEQWIQKGHLHRINGPAKINHRFMTYQWYRNGNDITKKVMDWIEKMKLPPYFKWSNDEHLIFALTFNENECY